MTTIAVNRREMAADSMGSVEHNGYSYALQKIRRVGDKVVGFSGQMQGIQRFLRWMEEGEDYEDLPEFDAEADDFTAIVLDADGIRRYEGSCFPIVVLDPFHATGNGAQAALAAMRCGRNPREAVELACEINPHTGPPVVSMTIGGGLAENRLLGDARRAALAKGGG